MSYGLLLTLRTVHVLGGAFWFGAALFNILFVVPTVRALGPGGGPFVAHMVQVRKLPLWINGAAWASILSGIWLYGWRSAWFTAPWMHQGAGLIYGAGGIAALVAAALGLTVLGPTAKRLGALGASLQAGGAPPPEVQAEAARLQRRMQRAGLAAVALIVLAALCMAVARYH